MKTIILFLLISLFLPLSVIAQQNQTPPTSLPQIIGNEDIVIRQPINNDLIVAGRQISIEDEISGDTYVAGGSVNITGTIQEDLIITGGSVNLSGVVNQNVIAAGGQLNISPTAQINGYLLAAGGQIELNGNIDGSVQLAGGEIIIKETAVVGGDLVVYSDNISISENAQITGERRIFENRTTVIPRPEINRLGNQINLISLIGQLLVTFVIIRLFYQNIAKLTSPIITSPLAMLGWGLLFLFIVPLVIILLLVTLIGIPLAILTAFIYLISLYLAAPVTIIALGRWLYSRGLIPSGNIYLQSFLSFILISVINFIPNINFFLRIIIILLGLGAIFKWWQSLLSVSGDKK